jgi:hypothetical protein
MSSTLLRLSLSSIIGILVAGSVFIIVSIGILRQYSIITIPLIVTLIAFIGSLFVNMTINGANCSLNMKRCSLAALITTGVAGILTLMFVSVEQFFPIFAFPFNTINFTTGSIGGWRMASIFGLIFALFWLITSAQLFATGISEGCD